MTCPVCGGETRVVDTRHPDCETVWRRRECTECGTGLIPRNRKYAGRTIRIKR